MKLPLSEILRPQDLKDVIGQDHVQKFLTKIIKTNHPLSLLFWGPPGSGKTTLAKLYAKSFSFEFISLSAVFSSISDLKKILKEKKEYPLLQQKLIIFVDEIHRFNKAQQDAFLPHIEDGSIILIGSTTENPSFTINNALLSRMRVLELNFLDPTALDKILTRYEKKFFNLKLEEEARDYLIKIAQGDGRYLLNLVENIQTLGLKKNLSIEDLKENLQRKPALFDKNTDNHFNLISALHKSIRGSDPQASLYWLSRILEGGEDPLYIARRLIRIASEDIGLADPNAITQTLNAYQTFHMLGSPEGELAIAQAVIYLALSPKSNALYVAFNKVKKLAQETSHLSPPKNILNAPTSLMKNLGYGKDYNYDHDEKHGFSGQNYFPEEIQRQNFYLPKEIGFEREMKKRLAYFSVLRKEKSVKK